MDEYFKNSSVKPQNATGCREVPSLPLNIDAITMFVYTNLRVEQPCITH